MREVPDHVLSAIVLDDHRMVAQAIAGVLSEVAGCEVLGVCATVPEACALIRRTPPQLLVLDVDLGADSYLEPIAVLQECSSEARVLFLTALADRFEPPPELEALTVAVVDKAQAWDGLLEVLERWRRSRSPLAEIAGCRARLQAIERLSPRERRLLLELGRGLLNKEIAVSLALSPATVETYRKNVASKLGVSGPELVRLATLYRAVSWNVADASAA